MDVAPSLFRTRQQIERYFSGKTIQCLLCGKRFRRLSFHLAAKHALTTDEYKASFGLPWTRGLSSAESHANSGWNRERKKNASKLARKTQFFKFAHPASRRQLAPFLRAKLLENLGDYGIGFDRHFELRVRTLFLQGHTDKEIAELLRVNRNTVRQRTKRWRKVKATRRSR